MRVVAHQAAPECLKYILKELPQAQMAPPDESRRRDQLTQMSQVARVFQVSLSSTALFGCGDVAHDLDPIVQVEALCYLREWNKAEAAIVVSTPPPPQRLAGRQ
jgi:hypothetical protein